jgi:hypothetical protein
MRTALARSPAPRAGFKLPPLRKVGGAHFEGLSLRLAGPRKGNGRSVCAQYVGACQTCQ